MGKKSQLRRGKKEQFIKERKAMLRAIELEKNPWENFWRRVDFWVYSVCLLLVMAYPFIGTLEFSTDSVDPKSSSGAIIHTSMGDIEIAFYNNNAPKTVENFSLLSKQGSYDNLTWHRVIKDFMIQGGDPKGDGTGGESAWGGYFNDEINAQSLSLTADAISKLEAKGYKYDSTLKSHKMEVGSVAMANSGPNTNGSQFFIITEQAQSHLDGQHTVFAHVTKGLEVAKAISEVEVDENDKPKEPVLINGVELK
jgi:peptidylprolyl isomerase domain and WD repeat-containing protein 1